MGRIGGSLTKGNSSPISHVFRGRATHLAGEGDEPPPLLLGCVLPLLLLICGAAAQIVVVAPLLIPPPLLPLGDGTSILSSDRRGGPHIGIDAQRWQRKRIQGLLIRPHPQDGGHVGGRIFHETLRVPIFLKCTVDTFFRANFRPKPPPPMPLLSLSSLLFSRLSLLFIYFFVRLFSSTPTESGFDPASE